MWVSVFFDPVIFQYLDVVRGKNLVGGFRNKLAILVVLPIRLCPAHEQLWGYWYLLWHLKVQHSIDYECQALCLGAISTWWSYYERILIVPFKYTHVYMHTHLPHTHTQHTHTHTHRHFWIHNTTKEQFKQTFNHRPFQTLTLVK